tara:strand:+ start:562 stop:1014 length:453 start_codon:yes stop_codon:yes gene_type:complete
MALIDPTPEGEALYELLVQVPRLNRLLKSLSAEEEPRWTIGLWGLLRDIKIDGPRTVPQIARARRLTRQQIQKLVDDAEAKGLVGFRQNPNHKRSRIVALTLDGTALFERIDGTIRETAQEMSEDFDIRDLDSALRVLFDLQQSLDARRR